MVARLCQKDCAGVTRFPIRSVVLHDYPASIVGFTAPPAGQKSYGCFKPPHSDDSLVIESVPGMRLGALLSQGSRTRPDSNRLPTSPVRCVQSFRVSAPEQGQNH